MTCDIYLCVCAAVRAYVYIHLAFQYITTKKTKSGCYAVIVLDVFHYVKRDEVS